MNIHLEDCEAFMAVVKAKTFVKAAERLEISPSMLSRRIHRLEATLKTRLFQRTTRSVALTYEGEQLVPRLRRTLDSLADLENLFENETEALQGPIRLTAPVAYAQKVLPPVLAQFRGLYPDVSLEIIATDSVLNLIEEQIDIAIRMHRNMSDSSFIARRIAANPIIACAAAQYLNTAPALRHPTDLYRHSLLFLDAHKRQAFVDTGLLLEQLVERRALSSNNGPVLTKLALQGQGILICSLWDVHCHLHSGELQQVLQDFPLELGSSAWLIFPSRENLPRRVRVLQDYLIKHLSEGTTAPPESR